VAQVVGLRALDEADREPLLGSAGAYDQGVLEPAGVGFEGVRIAAAISSSVKASSRAGG
jgi:hypothetical protein